MPGNKLPNSKSTEELLKSLDEAPKESVVDDSVVLEQDYKNDSLAFLSVYNIQPGKEEVNFSIIYYLYSNWSKQKLSRGALIRELSKFFVYKNVKTKTFILINQKALNLSKEAFKIIKARTREVTKEPSRKRHFESFLQACNVKPGDFYIEGYILFSIYDKWTYDNKCKNPLGEERFFKLLRVYFNCKAIAQNEAQYFGVDKNSFSRYHSQKKIKKIRKAKKERDIRIDKHGTHQEPQEGKKRKKKRLNPLSRLKPWSKSKE